MYGKPLKLSVDLRFAIRQNVGLQPNRIARARKTKTEHVQMQNLGFERTSE
jgi:hypothetical protein